MRWDETTSPPFSSLCAAFKQARLMSLVSAALPRLCSFFRAEHQLMSASPSTDRKTARTALQTAVAESVIPEDARVLCLQMLLLSGASPSHGGVNSAWMLALENDREKCEKSMTDFRRHGAGHGELFIWRDALGQH